MSICPDAMHHPVDRDDPAAGFVDEAHAPVSNAKPQVALAPSFHALDDSCLRVRMTIDGLRDAQPSRLVKAFQATNRPGGLRDRIVQSPSSRLASSESISRPASMSFHPSSNRR